jgi:hypothetical protein
MRTLKSRTRDENRGFIIHQGRSSMKAHQGLLATGSSRELRVANLSSQLAASN